jgi:hypothetical protein
MTTVTAMAAIKASVFITPFDRVNARPRMVRPAIFHPVIDFSG